MAEATLRIGVEVDASPMSVLAATSRELEGGLSRMAVQFMASGLSAKDAASALVSLGASEKDAAAACGLLSRETAVATTGVDGLSRAMAASGVRIAAQELGLNGMGMAFGRVAGASTALAGALQYAFPVFAAGAFVQVLGTMYEKLRVLEMESFLFAEAWQKIDHESASSFESLDRQIDRCDDKIAELTVGKLGALQLGMKQIGDGAVEMSGKLLSMFDAIGSQLEKEQPFWDKARDFIDFVSTKGMTPMPLNQGELAKAFGTELSKTLDTEGLDAGIEKVSRQIKIVNMELAKTPKDKQLDEYADQLIKILGLLEMRRRLQEKQQDVNRVEQGHAALEAAERQGSLESQLVADTQRYAKEDLKAWQEANDKREADDDRVNADMLVRARKDIEEFEKIQRDKAEAFVSTWSVAVHEQSEIFRQNQKSSEIQMQSVKVDVQGQTAGLSKGPISDALHAEGLQRESAVAQSAMAQSGAAAQLAQEKMGDLERQMGMVDTTTQTGVTEFQRLQGILAELQRDFDNATDATQRWGNTLKQIQAEQKTLMPSLSADLANAAQTGFAAFNSNFNKLITGGQTFARTMQNAWTAMAESFIQSALRMAEQWGMMELRNLQVSIRTTIQKDMLQKTNVAQTMAGDAAAAAADQTAAKMSTFGYAKLAAAKAYNSVAAIPVVGPALGAAAAAAAFALLMFEQGGLVPGSGATPIMAHGGEMVLPKNISTWVQSAAMGSGKSSSTTVSPAAQRPIIFQYHSHASALDADGINDVLASHGDKMFQYFRGRVRKMGHNV
jgi:hypothetical protein